MKRKTRRKIKNFILKTLAFIAGTNLVLWALLIDMLTRDGWILAFVVNGIGVLYLGLFFYANPYILELEDLDYDD